jgi:hypothetical protein
LAVAHRFWGAYNPMCTPSLALPPSSSFARPTRTRPSPRQPLVFGCSTHDLCLPPSPPPHPYTHLRSHASPPCPAGAPAHPRCISHAPLQSDFYIRTLGPEETPAGHSPLTLQGSTSPRCGLFVLCFVAMVHVRVGAPLYALHGASVTHAHATRRFRMLGVKR